MIPVCLDALFYGTQWSIKNRKYLWDGSLPSNTPIMDMMKTPPLGNKEFYIIDVFPFYQEKIPQNIQEVWHRTGEIMFMCKTAKNIEILKIIEKYSTLLKKMYNIFYYDEAKVVQKTMENLIVFEEKYRLIAKILDAFIIDVTRIGKKESNINYLIEDAGFSKFRIKKLIKEGEQDAIKFIESKKEEEK